MAFNQIPVNPSTPWGALLLQYRQQLISYRQQQAQINVLGASVLAKIAAMKDGTDYSRIEAQLGLSAGQGQAVYDQLNSVVGNIRDTDSHATVNAAIDQFDAFIG